jgi:hypothetical protein
VEKPSITPRHPFCVTLARGVCRYHLHLLPLHADHPCGSIKLHTRQCSTFVDPTLPSSGYYISLHGCKRGKQDARTFIKTKCLRATRPMGLILQTKTQDEGTSPRYHFCSVYPV